MIVPHGYRLGDWEVREPLASGAFGSVYLAHRMGGAADLPAVAALKFLPTGTGTPRQLRHYEDLVRREVDLYRKLTSPRLIRMYEALVVDDSERPELDGATVLVLERAESSLEALIGLVSLATPVPGPVPGGPVLLAQVCEGLAQLHEAGWVHGDLKPGNVLLMVDGSVRLGDFNLAAEMDGTHAYAPAFSTPDYTAPELLWSEVGARGQVIRPSADVWAFGIMAHLVLTGTHPFPGGTPSTRRDAVQAYGRGSERLRLAPDLPDAWRDVIRDCLVPTHGQRAEHTSRALLPRVRAAAKATSPVISTQRKRAPYVAIAAAALLVGAVAGFGTAGLREEPGATGYYRCPENSACFFSERDGKGEMCDWTEASTDWGRECPWAENKAVKSVFNNADELDPDHALVYFVERDHQHRKGCTSVHNQGNLAGTYTVRSHKWIERC